MPIVKDLMRIHLIRTCSYFCDIHFKIITGIMTDNVMPGHIRFPKSFETLIPKQIQHKVLVLLFI